MKTTLMAAAVAAFGIASAGQAATLSLDTSAATNDTIPGVAGKNDFLTFVGRTDLSGWFGAQVNLTGNTPILVEFFGREAGFSNGFRFGSTVISRVGGNNFSFPEALQRFVTTAAPGLLNFAFQTGGVDAVVNGSNPDQSTPTAPYPANFFAAFEGTDDDNGEGTEHAEGDPTTGQNLWLFFDDRGVVGDNHDDFVVRISVVPLPAAVIPFATVLGGLGAAAALRRRKAAKAA